MSSFLLIEMEVEAGNLIPSHGTFTPKYLQKKCNQFLKKHVCKHQLPECSVYSLTRTAQVLLLVWGHIAREPWILATALAFGIPAFTVL